MRIRAALVAVLGLLLIPAPAVASLENEQQQGKALVAQIRAGAKTCPTLTAEDLDHIGEYAMFRALGSTSLHQMGSARWAWMMGNGWRDMSRHDWQRLEQRMLGTSTGDDSGWSPVAIVDVTLGGVLLVAIAVLLVIRRPFRRPPASTTPA